MPWYSSNWRHIKTSGCHEYWLVLSIIRNTLQALIHPFFTRYFTCFLTISAVKYGLEIGTHFRIAVIMWILIVVNIVRRYNAICTCETLKHAHHNHISFTWINFDHTQMSMCTLIRYSFHLTFFYLHRNYGLVNSREYSLTFD